MVPTADLIRSTRLSCGITQRELAERLQTTQSAVARLEGKGGSPTVLMLERVMAALGKDLVLEAVEHEAQVDETLIAENLRFPPSERLDRFAANYENLRSISASVRFV